MKVGRGAYRAQAGEKGMVEVETTPTVNGLVLRRERVLGGWREVVQESGFHCLRGLDKVRKG